MKIEEELVGLVVHSRYFKIGYTEQHTFHTKLSYLMDICLLFHTAKTGFKEYEYYINNMTAYNYAM